MQSDCCLYNASSHCVPYDAGVLAAAECVARSRSEETQECACRLLRTLADGNPKFQTQVYRGLIALLSSSSAKAQHMAAQSLRIVQVYKRSVIARRRCVICASDPTLQSSTQ